MDFNHVSVIFLTLLLQSQQSAIHLASAKGHVDVAKALLSTGRVDLRATDKVLDMIMQF